MGLFGKKKEKKSCCCGDSCTPEKMAQAETAKTTAGVKVLGSGCAKCHRRCNRLFTDCRLWCNDDSCPCGRWQSCILWQGFEKRRGKSPHSKSQRMIGGNPCGTINAAQIGIAFCLSAWARPGGSRNRPQFRSISTKSYILHPS